MRRRTFLGTAMVVVNASPLLAALRGAKWDDAAEVLERATRSKQVESAVLHVAQGDDSLTRHFGQAASGDAMFL
ncbi:MAG: serine hydrolase, partial [Pirellulales bacterium]